MLSSLDGRVELQMPQGARLGVGIDAQPGRQAQTRSKEDGDAASQETRLDTLSARFIASDGVLTTETLRAGTGDKVITGSGNVNVAGRTLDLTVLVTGAPSGDVATPASEPSPLASFRVTGHWDAPSIRAATPANKAELSGPRPCGGPDPDLAAGLGRARLTSAVPTIQSWQDH